MASAEEQKEISKVLNKFGNLINDEVIKKGEDIQLHNSRNSDYQREIQEKEKCTDQTTREETEDTNGIVTIAAQLSAKNVNHAGNEEDEKVCFTNNLVIDLENEEEDTKSKELEHNAIVGQKILSEEKDIESEGLSNSFEKGKTVDLTEVPLSEGEEEEQSTTAAAEAILGKPGKVKKRRSVGIAGLQIPDDEHYRLKRRKINVEGAPKMPLTGYVRYMNDRREVLRKEHPNKTSIEHTKIIGEEWQTMSIEAKGPYMQAAELDKQRYVKELHSFLKSRPDVLASELAKNKPRKSLDSNININANTSIIKETSSEVKSHTSSKDTTKEKVMNKSPLLFNTHNNQKPITEALIEKDKTLSTLPPSSAKLPLPPAAQMLQSQSQTLTNNASVRACNVENTTDATAAASTVAPTPSEIPIFTNEFLEHNKLYDTELKTLRKSKIDLEQQNAILEKYVENMKNGLNKMVNENNKLQEKNRLLEVYLDKLKRKLAQALNGLPLPNIPSGATIDNIEQYMKELYSMSNTNTHGPATLNKAKDIIRKLDLQIQL